MSDFYRFPALSVKSDNVNKCVYITDVHRNRRLFQYTIYCKYLDNVFLFDVPTSKMIVIRGASSSLYTILEPFSKGRGFEVATMGFSIVNDDPIPAVKLFHDWHEILTGIRTEFRDKLAAFQLDNIINE
jgi:hypothetical protein